MNQIRIFLLLLLIPAERLCAISPESFWTDPAWIQERAMEGFAIDQRFVLVGKPLAINSATNIATGEVAVFERIGGDYVRYSPQETLPLPPQFPPDGKFGSHIVLDFPYLATSSPEISTGGRVDIYHFQGNIWQHQQTIYENVAGQPIGRFATSMIMKNNLLFINSPNSVINNFQAGEIFIYQLTSGQNQWTLLQHILPNSPNQLQQFSHSMAFTGNTLVVGAPGAIANQYGHTGGVVYIFRKQGNSPYFSLAQELITSDLQLATPAQSTIPNYWQNGSKVTLSDDEEHVVFSAVGMNYQSGAVYYFKKDSISSLYQEQYQFSSVVATNGSGSGSHLFMNFPYVVMGLGTVNSTRLEVFQLGQQNPQFLRSLNLPSDFDKAVKHIYLDASGLFLALPESNLYSQNSGTLMKFPHPFTQFEVFHQASVNSTGKSSEIEIFGTTLSNWGNGDMEIRFKYLPPSTSLVLYATASRRTPCTPVGQGHNCLLGAPIVVASGIADLSGKLTFQLNWNQGSLMQIRQTFGSSGEFYLQGLHRDVGYPAANINLTSAARIVTQ